MPALLNSFLFLHQLLLTFLLGAAILPSGLRFINTPYWNLLSVWVAGFMFQTAGAVAVALTVGLTQSHAVVSTAVFWLVIGVARKRVRETLSSLKIPAARKKLSLDDGIVLFTVAVLGVFMVLAALAPHTKADELTYHMFYTKSLAENGRFVFHYTPLEQSFFMPWQIYNAWPYLFGGEFVSALNSVFLYFLGLFLLYHWCFEKWGEQTALWSMGLSAFVIGKIVFSIAGGDNSVNHLLVMSLSMLAFDLCLKPQPNSTQGEENKKLALLIIISGLAALVKVTAVIPAALLGFAAFSSRCQIKDSRAGTALLQGVVCLLPFVFFLFLKQFFVYGNPFFPFFSKVLGAGPYVSAEVLAEGFDRIRRASELTPEAVLGVISRIPNLVFKYVNTFQPYPPAWIALIAGTAAFAFRCRLRLVLACAASFLIAFHSLSSEFFRFYSGILGVMTAAGVGVILSVETLKRNSKGILLLRVALNSGFILLLAGTLIYLTPFAVNTLQGSSRQGFLDSRVQCIKTIDWINQNLPQDAFILTETRERYYFDRRVEGFDPVLLGYSPDTVQDSERFKDLLDQKGVTHLLIIGPELDSALHRFVEEQPQAEKIFSLENEVVLGRRFRNPVFGQTAVYSWRGKYNDKVI